MATLPAVPTGKELEDFVAGYFQAGGYYVEKNIEGVPGATGSQMLELDLVATRYQGGVRDERLVEVKGGGWSHGDLFKVLGWMKYLDIRQGAFVCTSARDAETVARAKAEFAKHALDLVYVDDLTKFRESMEAEGFSNVIDDSLVSPLRWSFWVERCLLERLRAFQRSNRDSEGPRHALDYYRLVNNGVFFAEDVRERLRRLYDAYMAHPRLTLGCAAEMEGQGYDPENANPANQSMRDAIFNGEHPFLQACMYAEHRARLTILKAAVDYIHDEAAGALSQPPRRELNLGGVTVRPDEYEFLPDTLKQGIEWLKSRPRFEQYPRLWQVFLWTWGGFFLKDRIDEEIRALARQANIPEDQVLTALEAFDQFFRLREVGSEAFPQAR